MAPLRPRWVPSANQTKKRSPLSSYLRNGNSFSWLFIEIGHVTRSIYLSHALCPRRIGFMEARTETLREHPHSPAEAPRPIQICNGSSAERDESSPLDPDPWAEISSVNPTLDYPGDPVQGICCGKWSTAGNAWIKHVHDSQSRRQPVPNNALEAARSTAACLGSTHLMKDFILRFFVSSSGLFLSSYLRREYNFSHLLLKPWWCKHGWEDIISGDALGAGHHEEEGQPGPLWNPSRVY